MKDIYWNHSSNNNVFIFYDLILIKKNSSKDKRDMDVIKEEHRCVTNSNFIYY